MKKFLFLFLILISFCSVKAETLWFNAHSYAYKAVNNYGYWADWSDWLTCDVNIKFELDNDIIIIYSNKTQIYAVYNYKGKYSDYSGGVQYYYDVLDQDYDKGLIRLRVESNGNSQIYCEFANVMWVYNVIRIK